MTVLRRSGMVAVNRIVAETVCTPSGLDRQTRRWPPLPVVIHNHGSRDGRDRISVPHRHIGAMLTEAGYVAFVPERSTANLNAKRGISYRAVFYEAWPKAQRWERWARALLGSGRPYLEKDASALLDRYLKPASSNSQQQSMP